METLLQDVRFGARTLLRNPAFAFVAVVTLALGVGANAAIFSVVNAVLLRPLPWGEPDRVVTIWSRWTAFDKTWVSDGEVNDYRREAKTLAAVGAWDEGAVNLTGDGNPERIASGTVTANLFSVLGVQPVRGRAFTPQEDVPNGPRVAIIGYGLWQRRYAGDPGIVGRSVPIDGESYQVVGIMPKDFVLPTDFQSPTPTAIWLPARWDGASADHGNHGYYAAARLADGVTVEQASEELHAITQRWIERGLYPKPMQYDALVLPLRADVLGTMRRAVWLLFGAVGFLLRIACANVANLLLARGEARQREIAARVALGAGRLRILRQLVTEGAVLAAAGAAVGLLLAFSMLRLISWWNPGNIPRLEHAAVDARALLFTLALTLLTTFVFSLAPAVRLLRSDLTDAIKQGSANATVGSARQRFRSALIVAQMALAVMLLVGAGLMIRTLWSLQHIDLGFNPTGVLTMRLSLPRASYATDADVSGFYTRLVEEVKTVPGVSEAGAARVLPLASTIGDFGLRVDGYVPPPGTNAKGDWQIVTPGYIEAMGEQIARGRTLLASDTATSQLVGLINEEMARKYWAGRDAVGGRFRIGSSAMRPWITVVGIVKSVRHNGVAGVVKEKFYIPHTQWAASVGSANNMRAMTLVVRTSGRPAVLSAPVRAAIARLDPALPVADVRSMDDVVSSAMSTPRFTGLLLGAFALLALILSAVGIYGLLSFLVSRRTREIGIRVAIGADRGRVLALVLRNAAVLAVSGAIAGTVGALALTRLLQKLLHGVTPHDPATLAASAAALIAVALAASAVPAWRASRVNPVVALRSD
jgi:putative ABC transport system permease protein